MWGQKGHTEWSLVKDFSIFYIIHKCSLELDILILMFCPVWRGRVIISNDDELCSIPFDHIAKHSAIYHSTTTRIYCRYSRDREKKCLLSSIVTRGGMKLCKPIYRRPHKSLHTWSGFCCECSNRLRLKIKTKSMLIEKYDLTNWVLQCMVRVRVKLLSHHFWNSL